MSERELSPELQGTLQLISALFGLIQAFKGKYGEEALKVSEAYLEKMGSQVGGQVKEKAGITGSGLGDMERVLQIWIGPMITGPPFKTLIEGNKLTISRESPTICPAMRVAKQLNVPLEMVCKTVTIPTLRGVIKAVNPDAKHVSVQLSEQKCVEAIEVP